MGICPKYKKILEICPKNLKNPLKNPVFFPEKIWIFEIFGANFFKKNVFGGKFPKILENFKKNLKNLRKKMPEKKFRSKKYFFSDVYYRQIFDISLLWT